MLQNSSKAVLSIFELGYFEDAVVLFFPSECYNLVKIVVLMVICGPSSETDWGVGGAAGAWVLPDPTVLLTCTALVLRVPEPACLCKVIKSNSQNQEKQMVCVDSTPENFKNKYQEARYPFLILWGHKWERKLRDKCMNDLGSEI